MVARVADLRMLQASINAYGPSAEKAVVSGLRKAARFGHTAVQRTYARTRDPYKIRASGSYGQAFVIGETPVGAFLANAMFYAVFVERGRRKGKPPPLAPILEWVYQKRIAARPKPLIRVKTPKNRKKPFIGPRQQKAGGGRAQKFGPRKKKGRKKRGGALQRLRARRHAIRYATDIAQRVRWKIAKHGTKGRWVLRRTMPAIAKRSARDVKRELSRLNKKPPVRT